MALFSYRKGNVIEEQMKSLGSSFDWRRNFFTLDEVIAVCKLREPSKLQHHVNLSFAGGDDGGVGGTRCVLYIYIYMH